MGAKCARIKYLAVKTVLGIDMKFWFIIFVPYISGQSGEGKQSINRGNELTTALKIAEHCSSLSQREGRERQVDKLRGSDDQKSPKL
jgi:hypothetical protein